MCSPSLLLGGGQAGASAIGAWSSARGQQASLRAEARTAEFNAQLRELDADRALYVGQVNANVRRARGRRDAASQVAAMAANGIVVGEGVAATVEASTDYVAELDADAIEMEARWRALGLRGEARNQRLSAYANRQQAKAISPGLAVASSFISSASSMLSSQIASGGFGGGGRVAAPSASSLSARLPSRVDFAPIGLPSGFSGRPVI